MAVAEFRYVLAHCTLSTAVWAACVILFKGRQCRDTSLRLKAFACYPIGACVRYIGRIAIQA